MECTSPSASTLSTAADSNGEAKYALAACARWCGTQRNRSVRSVPASLDSTPGTPRTVRWKTASPSGLPHDPGRTSSAGCGEAGGRTSGS